MTSGTERSATPEPVSQIRFGRSRGVPNNPNLPVLLRRDVKRIVDDPAACEALFASHGWGGSWRNGIFPFHHFHSNAHEALGIVQGRASVLLGGPDGTGVTLRAGDVVVLPAGTGHKRLGATPDLLVVGAYPKGQENYDLCRGEPDDFEEVARNVAQVPLPESDPVEGADGPLVHLWSEMARDTG
jgi:uncharacterized protein YjlB